MRTLFAVRVHRERIFRVVSASSSDVSKVS